MKGEQVKQIIFHRGFTLREIAERIGETPQNLNSLLSVQDIKTGVLERIATAMNFSLSDFFKTINSDFSSDTEMTEKDKLKYYLEHKGYSKNSFYVNTGLSIGFLDSGKSLGTDKVKTILANYPDLSLEWLILDKGPMLSTDNEPALLTRMNFNQEDPLVLLLHQLANKDVTIESLNQENKALIRENEHLKQKLNQVSDKI